MHCIATLSDPVSVIQKVDIHYSNLFRPIPSELCKFKLWFAWKINFCLRRQPENVFFFSTVCFLHSSQPPTVQILGPGTFLPAWTSLLLCTSVQGFHSKGSPFTSVPLSQMHNPIPWQETKEHAAVSLESLDYIKNVFSTGINIIHSLCPVMEDGSIKN